MKPIRSVCMIAVLALGASLSSQTRTQERPALEGCPARVAATAARVLGDLTGAKVTRETDTGATTYEIEVVRDGGMKLSADVAENGELIAFERSERHQKAKRKHHKI